MSTTKPEAATGGPTPAINADAIYRLGIKGTNIELTKAEAEQLRDALVRLIGDGRPRMPETLPAPSPWPFPARTPTIPRDDEWRERMPYQIPEIWCVVGNGTSAR